MEKTYAKRKNIIIGLVIIVVLVVSSIGALIFYQQLTTTRINLSISTVQTNVMQGSNLQIPVKVTSTGNPENITLNTIIDSNAIRCSFEPSIGTSSFTSILIINVPESTPTGNYSLLVTASGKTAIANASCIVSVLSANVTVSGRIQIYSPYGVNIDSLQFKDVQTKVVYTVAPSIQEGEPPRYSIALRNEQTYNVTVNFHYGVGSLTPFSASGYIGNLTVYASTGNNTMQGQDFTYYHLQ